MKNTVCSLAAAIIATISAPAHTSIHMTDASATNCIETPRLVL